MDEQQWWATFDETLRRLVGDREADRLHLIAREQFSGLAMDVWTPERAARLVARLSRGDSPSPRPLDVSGPVPRPRIAP